MIADNTPVLIGAGQFTERLDDPDYQGLSAVELAARAASAALADAGITEDAHQIDLISTTRTFEDSATHLAFPFGRSNNFPRSVCKRLGINPAYAIWAAAGGDSPQRLVTEACERIARGTTRGALVCGAEAISTARHLMKQGVQKDWSDTVDGQVEDRGTDGFDMITANELRHGLMAAPPLYGLLENARRASRGLDRDRYAATMGDLFAPFTQVAAQNRFSSMANRAYSSSELVTVTASNRMIADPYPRLLVARDQVNQSAAVVVVAAGLARELGIPESRWVFLHGYGHASERPLLERPDLGCSPAARAALQTALSQAEISANEVSLIDLYSCFPIAVSHLCDDLGLAEDDARGLTLTGGLPYFGGPGNNYSMHAIAEVVQQLREHPGEYGLVSANGGFLSKHAVGVYSTRPRPFITTDCSALQKTLDAVPAVPSLEHAQGMGHIETYTLIYNRHGEPETGIIIGRLHDSNARFTACTGKADPDTPVWMHSHEPLGARIVVESAAEANYFRIAGS